MYPLLAAMLNFPAGMLAGLWSLLGQRAITAAPDLGEGTVICHPSDLSGPPLWAGKGDLIGSDFMNKDRVIKTNANVKALTYCDLQYIGLKGLREVLELYPEYSQKFITEIQHDLTYNLRKGSEADLEHESNGGLIPKLPSILEDEEFEEDERCPLSASTKSINILETSLKLPKAFSSPMLSPLSPRTFKTPTKKVPNLGDLLGIDGKGKHLAGDEGRPCKLQLPSLSISAPPVLSPRFVDGIETDCCSPPGQKFEFNMRQLSQENSLASCNTGENAETRKSIVKLNQEMCSLSQQVTQLSKDLNEMLQLIRPVIMTQGYLPSPATSLLSPSLNNTYSNSSGFSSGQQSQAPICSLPGQTCTGQMPSQCLQPTPWCGAYTPSTLPQTAMTTEHSDHLPRKNVHPALSLDSFLRHQCQHPMGDRGCGSLAVTQSPCHTYLPQTPLTHMNTVPHSSSSPVMAPHPGQQTEPKQANASSSLVRPFCPSMGSSDTFRDRVADLLGPGTRDFKECSASSVTSLELVRSSSGDSQGDIIRFIDDEGTNV